MSNEARENFIKHVETAIVRLSSDFNVVEKKRDIDGFVVRITCSFGEGSVEFLFGPPEYQAEVFITVKKKEGSQERYDLAKLMSLPHLKYWVARNRPFMGHGDRVRAEVEWYTDLIRELKSLPEFAENTNKN